MHILKQHNFKGFDLTFNSDIEVFNTFGIKNSIDCNYQNLNANVTFDGLNTFSLRFLYHLFPKFYLGSKLVTDYKHFLNRITLKSRFDFDSQTYLGFKIKRKDSETSSNVHVVRNLTSDVKSIMSFDFDPEDEIKAEFGLLKDLKDSYI